MENKGTGKSGKVISTMVCLPPALIAQIDRKASEEGSFSRSAIIRRACMAYLDNDTSEFQATEEAA